MNSKKKKILIVDDDPDNVELLVSRLMQNGYDTVTAYDGSQAVQKAVSEKPDLILLDYMMPVSDGLKVYENYQMNVHIKHIPVIIITACVDRGIKEKFMKAGVFGLIVKPYDPQEVLALVNGALGK